MNPKGKTRLKNIGLYVCIILILLVYLFPIMWQISTSLKESKEVFSGYNFIPKKITWENYRVAWTQFNVKRYLFNTIVVSFAITCGTLVFCSMAGYAYGQLNFPGKNILFFLFLSTLMVPVTVTLIPAYIIILTFNWGDTYWGLIMPYFFGSALGTFLMRQFYMSIPKDLSEAATIDGAGYLQIWWSIMLPMSKPALMTLGVMTLVLHWNNLIWPLVITHSPQLKVLAVGLSDFRLYRTIQWNSMMAAVMIATAPMLIILMTAQRFFIKGIQLQGVSR